MKWGAYLLYCMQLIMKRRIINQLAKVDGRRCQKYLGHAATKPDKVNMRPGYDVAVKLTSMTDDILKSNNGAYS